RRTCSLYGPAHANSWLHNLPEQIGPPPRCVVWVKPPRVDQEMPADQRYLRVIGVPESAGNSNTSSLNALGFARFGNQSWFLKSAYWSQPQVTKQRPGHQRSATAKPH